MAKTAEMARGVAAEMGKKERREVATETWKEVEVKKRVILFSIILQKMVIF